MHASSQRTPAARHWAQHLHLTLTALILVGIVSEGLLIGPSLFTDINWGRAAHGDLAVLLLLLTLLPLVGRLAHVPGRTTALSLVLFGLTVTEVMTAMLGREVPFLAALHPANAMLMAGLTAFLFIHGRHGCGRGALR
jgi:hypothetical protein